jgi:predicted nuclease of predicted toxin-antitoxin system
MRLLFDQNLSFKLCDRLADLFPDSDQVRRLDLDRADDQAIWRYAQAHDFMLVTQDADFADLAAVFGPPPKVIWLRCGNQPTDAIERLLRQRAEIIGTFGKDPTAACLEVF